MPENTRAELIDGQLIYNQAAPSRIHQTILSELHLVSPSNAKQDYIRKLNLYADAGVREYWIVDPGEERVFVYALEQENFKVKSYTFQDAKRMLCTLILYTKKESRKRNSFLVYYRSLCLRYESQKVF